MNNVRAGIGTGTGCKASFEFVMWVLVTSHIANATCQEKVEAWPLRLYFVGRFRQYNYDMCQFQHLPCFLCMLVGGLAPVHHHVILLIYVGP